MREGFFAVNVLAHFHGYARNGVVHVVGRADDNSIEVFGFFFKHFAKILVVRRVGKLPPKLHGHAVVHVAEGHNVVGALVERKRNINVGLAPASHGGNVEFVAGSHEAFAQHVARHNHKTNRCHGPIFQKGAAVESSFFGRNRVLIHSFLVEYLFQQKRENLLLLLVF